MTKYYMEVLTKKAGIKQWEKVRPTHGSPYQFDTERKALDMLEMCYPEQDFGKEVRINREA